MNSFFCPSCGLQLDNMLTELFNKYMSDMADLQKKRIGERIKQLRVARKIKAKDLARISGITPQSISRIEKGRHDVNMKTLDSILKAMGCTLRDLVIET